MTLPSRVTSQGTAHYPPAATFGPRHMRDFEFVHILKGHCTYICDGIAHDAPENAIALCVPGTVDQFIWDPHRPTVHGFFHFEVRPPRSLGDSTGWPRVVLAKESSVLVPLFQHVMATSQRDSTTTALSIDLLIRVFVLGQGDTHVPSLGALPPAIEAAMNAIFARLDTDPRSPPTFDDLVRASHVSREHLCRLFAKHVGHSPMKTLMLARLDRAMGLVARSNFSIKEIASAMGFATPFHFSRSFTQAFGQSPQQLRDSTSAGRFIPLPRLLKVDRAVSADDSRVS